YLGWRRIFTLAIKNVLGIVAAAIAAGSVSCSALYSLDQLQGAWWSNFNNPTADFAIKGNLVWLDTDSQYHPCRIEGDRLVFDLPGGQGAVIQKIVGVGNDTLLLEDVVTNTRILYRRVKS
ncbi:MAG TPA: hypothetical protein VFK65_13185, partial [Candidatus Binatia bacterium]|nr:hypothetical protein [Candidatus Binatia bacterium]